jgi:uncharacterized repeat protein (TIGR01451 family)
LLLLCLFGVLWLWSFAQPAHAQQQPGPIIIEKFASVTEAGSEEVFSYTIRLQNTSPDLVANELGVFDQLPPDVVFVGEPDPNAVYDQAKNTLAWRAISLKPNEERRLVFPVKVLPFDGVTKCGKEIINQAQLNVPGIAPLPALPVIVILSCPDLGDAPDSSNHSGAVMTAYLGPVNGNYPSVFDPTTGLPQGPRHRLPRADAWLGNAVSRERDADLFFDEDGVANLDPPSNAPDRDKADDGLVRLPTVANCAPTSMNVQVTIVGGVKKRFINAWIDWNRDGDWADVYTFCPGAAPGDWVVQDFVTTLANGVYTITLPTFIAVNPSNQIQDHWLRVTLSDAPAAKDPANNLADGRGPPTGFKFGETEDFYTRLLPPQGEPKLEIVKGANVTQTIPGGIIEFAIKVTNSGAGPATGVTVQDPIPAGTTYIPGTLTASAPTPDDSNPAVMKWSGNIPAGGSVIIKFKVKVNADFQCPSKIVNVAEMMAATGQPLGVAPTVVDVVCPSGEPKLTIRKGSDVTQTTPGGTIEYTIVVQNSGTGPALGVTVLDSIPAFTSYQPGTLIATAPTPDDSNPAVMKWSGNIPAGGSVTIKFKVIVTSDFQCPGKVINVARLFGNNGQVIAGAENIVGVNCPGGEPKLIIRKTANVTQTTPGGVIEFTITVQNSGTASAFAVTVLDPIPPGTTYVPTSLTASAPTTDDSNPAVMKWTGNVPVGGTVTIKFKVTVNQNIPCPSKIINFARLLGANGQLLGGAEAVVEVLCSSQDPQIKLEKSVLVEGAQQPVVDASILPGGSAVYYLTLSSSDGLSHTVTISDNLPSGLIAVAVSSSSGVANIVNSGQGVIWTGILGPGTSPVTIKIQVRITQDLECNRELVNVAKWFSQGFSGQSNPVMLRFTCRDLGDAPDSTNHLNVKMSAYTGVQANYPTVFAVSAPEQGPRHEFPRPFFLGKSVSHEIEADLGFDVDGVNNLRPATDQADLDKADDGLLLSSVAFRHCQASTLQVVVTITPMTLALLPDKVGYLNIWVDSNRDGDWADKFDCPQTATGAPGVALEHIVIDHIVDVATLGAGVHLLTINTTGLVPWPDTLAQRSAWLRLTLSEQKSNKPFGSYGDGRGYSTPFRLGETEDYLLRGQEATQTTADVNVHKHGEIWPDFDPATAQRRWVIGWVVNYSNAGPAAANNLHVIDSFDPAQTLLAEHSIPLVPHTQSGNTLDYNVGTLPAGGSGLVIIRTSAPWNTPPGTVFTNTATTNSSNDNNTLNNSSVATVTVPILPPIISEPLAGSTCTGTVSVKGNAQPGAVVDLYVDSVLVASTLPVDAGGNWNYTLTGLSNGSHAIYAVAQLGSLSSPPSPTVVLIVDNTLFWDPISLRFSDDMGHVILPSGRLDESGWTIFLRPGHTYTVSLRVCCEDPNAQVTMEVNSTPPISLTLTDPDGDRIYTASFTIPVGGRFAGAVRICVTCNLIRRCSDGQVTIDPEGTVFDLLLGTPVNGANVACLQAGVSAASGEQVFSLWPAANFGQINPQTVGVDGYFSFFTPQGAYRLNVSKSGYQPYVSPDLNVVDAPVHYDVPLTPIINQAAGAQIAISDNGFEPAVLTVAPGTVIEWINASEGVHSSTSITPAVKYEGVAAASLNADSGAWDSGLLQTGESYKRQLNAVGVYTYTDSVNPENMATVIVATPQLSDRRIFLPVILRN